MRELLELYWDELAAWGALVNLLLTALTIA